MNKAQPLKAILLDDEEDACKNLQSLLKRYWNNRIEIAGIAMSTAEAAIQLKSVQPDVLFIDIEMPGENAFQFLERISPFSFEIIFVTAYDEYALRALKLNAVDYILKPISLDELESAIAKLEEKVSYKMLAQKAVGDNNFTQLSEQVLQKQNPEKIVLKSKSDVRVVHFKDIFYIEANGSYAQFYFKEKDKMESIIMSRPLVDYEELLPQDIFFRSHKSFLVNCRHVNKVHKDEHFLVEMKDGKLLPLSRRRHQGLLDFLQTI